MKNSSLLAVLLLLVNCAGLQEAKSPEDAEAKRFSVIAHKAVIYVFREPGQVSLRKTVTINGHFMGKTGPNTFIREEVEPGQCRIYSEGDSELELDAKPSHLYYIRQEIKPGFPAVRTVLSLADEHQARAMILKGHLIDSSNP